jgi:iron complex outermembrane receptor protein
VTAPFIDALSPAPGDTGTASVADPFARQAWSNRSTQSTVDDLGGDIRMNWKGDWLGGAKLTSITSLRKWESIAGADLDYTTADLFYREPTESDGLLRTETFTQEFRLEGSTSQFDWQVGVAYLQEDLDRNEAYRTGSAYEAFLSLAILQRINPLLASSPTAPLFLSQASGRPFGTVFPVLTASDQYQQETSRTSLFTNNTWHVTEALDLSFGVRLTLEDKDLTSSYANPGPSGCSSMLTNPAQVVAALVARGLSVAQASAAAPQVIGFACQPWTNTQHNGRLTVQSTDDTEWSGTLKAAYQFDEHVMAYISASRDYKPAGFNMDRVQSNTGLPSGTNGNNPVDDTSFGAESVESYELGVRTNWMDGALRFDATLFHQRISDYQFSDFNGVSTRVLSIPDVTSTGVDASLVWSRDGLSVQAGLTYADTTYGDDVLPDATLGLLPGSQLSFAPKWTINGAIGYTWSVGDHLKLQADVGARFVSDHNTGYDLAPAKAQDAYTLINARLALAQSEGAWSIELWGQNLTDEDYLEQSFDTPLQIDAVNAFLGAPRTLGVTLRLEY